jgi:hypothetical protein
MQINKKFRWQKFQKVGETQPGGLHKVGVICSKEK